MKATPDHQAFEAAGTDPVAWMVYPRIGIDFRRKDRTLAADEAGDRGDNFRDLFGWSMVLCRNLADYRGLGCCGGEAGWGAGC